MEKGRLVAFTDAVIAFVITILVLDLELPAAPTMEALWEIREGFFAYAVSFFWIGATWINLHNQWHRARRITTRVVWHSVLMLFFISLIPYVTRFAGSNLMSMFALGVYWAVCLLTTISFMAQGYALGYYNRDDPVFLASTRVLNHWMWVDLGVNIAGLPLALALRYPPVVLIVIFVAALIPSIVIRHLNREFEAVKDLGEDLLPDDRGKPRT